jgi:hypothetical protein
MQPYQPQGTKTHIIQRLLTGILFLIAAFVFLSSCKKDNVSQPVKPVDTLLTINFNNSTINKNLFDSAFVILERKSSNLPYIIRFLPAGETVQASIDGLRNGEYTAGIFLYARVANTGDKREYFLQKDLVIGSHEGEIRLLAPNGTLTNEWHPRAFLSYNSGIDFYIALDNTDPYFRIRVADQNKWKKIEVYRTANKKIPGAGTEVVAGGAWTCESDCFPDGKLFEDRVSFKPFTEKVKGKVWNLGEIEIVAEQITGQKTEDYYRYDNDPD